MKKTILLPLAGLLLSLTACNNQQDIITIWAWNQNVAIMEDAISRYKEIEPSFNGKVESFSQGDIQTKFFAAKQLANPTSLADVMLIDAMNLNVYYDQWSDLFYDFNDDIDETSLELFVPSTIQVSTIDEKLIAMPYGIAPTYVFAYRPLWNQTWLDDILENGWTWDDYKIYGQLIKLQNTTKDVYMTAYNLRIDDRLYRTMTSQKGEWFTDNEGEIVYLANENSIQAMTWVKDYFSSGVLGHVDTGDYRSMMLNGQIAAQIQGFFLGGQLKNVGAHTSGDWVLLPLPSWSEADTSASITGGTYLYVNNMKPNKSKAADFVAWYTTNVDALVSGLSIGGIFPAVVDTYSTDYFAEPDAFFGNQAYLEQVASSVPLAPAIYASKYNAWIYDQYALAQEKILFDDVGLITTLDGLKNDVQAHIQG